MTLLKFCELVFLEIITIPNRRTATNPCVCCPDATANTWVCLRNTAISPHREIVVRKRHGGAIQWREQCGLVKNETAASIPPVAARVCSVITFMLPPVRDHVDGHLVAREFNGA
jgi:hypothetical protein